ncbi:MAG: hypothetical protein N4A45_01790 [Flavobacteriales bacterium]|jgi:hypothetical protein|nr:hypothetical protein [Flavobacteriales bacterium]
MNQINHILSQSERNSLTSEDILRDLMTGNVRFVAQMGNTIDYKQQLYELENEENPKALILADIDTKISVETILDQGFGDLIVMRTPGGILTETDIEAIEATVALSGVKLVIALANDNSTFLQNIQNHTDKFPTLRKYLPKGNTTMEMAKELAVSNKKMISSLDNVHAEVVSAVYRSTTGMVEILR